MSNTSKPMSHNPLPELRAQLDDLGYQRVFDAIAESVNITWRGTAIGISVETFIAALTGCEKRRSRARWPCECSNPVFDGEEILANDGALRCRCGRPLSGDPE